MYDPVKKLAARIEARNRAGEVANELFPKFLAIFKQLAGQKICKADGTFLKKIVDQLPESSYPDKWPKPTVMYYRNSSDYSVSFTIKTCASDNNGSCAYETVTVYICDLGNGIVQTNGQWYDPPNFRTNYNAAEITRLRTVFLAKKAELDKARSDLFPFGETDN